MQQYLALTLTSPAKTLETVNPNVENPNAAKSVGKNLPTVTEFLNNQPLKTAKENFNKLIIPKLVQTQMVQQCLFMEEKKQHEKGGDFNIIFDKEEKFGPLPVSMDEVEDFRYLHLEEEFWKQKSGLSWFQDGDRNTKFFHAQVNARRKRLQLQRIQNNARQWLENMEEIVDETVNFFQSQFTEDRVPNAFGILDHVPSMVNMLQNEELVKQPSKEEVKKEVFELNGDSAGGPDGFHDCFYQACWEIVSDDIVDMVNAFFSGHDLPRYNTYTNLVLFPKKKEVTTYSNMRPIGLCNFINKVFSRVIHERIVDLLPNLICDDQAGIVKGRIIVENVLLT
ncbi:PREDICTED: uncharacterized protein LOC109224275 [Nicotiana attenuata]|uniref:uncharacterized protein LOC109224275 n=1 Tax=Nicotiana attenuata TaxID=49451 RepID=UPI0009051149|nr:PREDICTED: uncharacterized protein LOC109224275 [Nicotiana attenuata]